MHFESVHVQMHCDCSYPRPHTRYWLIEAICVLFLSHSVIIILCGIAFTMQHYKTRLKYRMSSLPTVEELDCFEKQSKPSSLNTSTVFCLR